MKFMKFDQFYPSSETVKDDPVFIDPSKIESLQSFDCYFDVDATLIVSTSGANYKIKGDVEQIRKQVEEFITGQNMELHFGSD